MAQAASIIGAIERTDILSRIGNTPLLRLARITADLPGIEIYAQSRVLQSRRIGEGPRRRST